MNATDSLALVDLYNSTDGHNWVNRKNWFTTKPVATWHGIYVADNRVTNISLLYNNLTGALPHKKGQFHRYTLSKNLEIKVIKGQ